LLRGNIGRAGAGVCPVRGHSNVQGDRTMGIWEKMPAVFLDRLGAEDQRDTPIKPKQTHKSHQQPGAVRPDQLLYRKLRDRKHLFLEEFFDDPVQERIGPTPFGPPTCARGVCHRALAEHSDPHPRTRRTKRRGAELFRAH